MYVPNHFKEENQEKLQQYIRDYSFGLLVIADDEEIEAIMFPFICVLGQTVLLGIFSAIWIVVTPPGNAFTAELEFLPSFKGQMLTLPGSEPA